MGLLTRIRDLIAANLLAMLDEAEEPERVLERLLREMEQGASDLRVLVAKAVTEEKRWASSVAEVTDEVRSLERQSEEAVQAGHEDEARRSIARRLAAERRLSGFREQLNRARATRQELKHDLDRLEEKARDARRSYEELLERKQAAEERLRAADATHRVEDRSSKADALLTDRPGALRETVEGAETVAEAIREIEDSSKDLDTTFAAMENNDQVEKLLQELKARLNR